MSHGRVVSAVAAIHSVGTSVTPMACGLAHSHNLVHVLPHLALLPTLRSLPLHALVYCCSHRRIAMGPQLSLCLQGFIPSVHETGDTCLALDHCLRRPLSLRSTAAAVIAYHRLDSLICLIAASLHPKRHPL